MRKGQQSLQFSFIMKPRDLTCALMKRDFQLEWDIPDNHLCPGITGRINYLNELHELLMADQENNVTNKIMKGVDIGTGASCVYPLLGYSLYKWHFIATDIDTESVDHANHLVSQNHLTDFIQCVQRNENDFLLKDLVDSKTDFVMCNPPFFDNPEEVCIIAYSSLG